MIGQYLYITPPGSWNRLFTPNMWLDWSIKEEWNEGANNGQSTYFDYKRCSLEQPFRYIQV
jgi:hypothetical protein